MPNDLNVANILHEALCEVMNNTDDCSLINTRESRADYQLNGVHISVITESDTMCCVYVMHQYDRVGDQLGHFIIIHEHDNAINRALKIDNSIRTHIQFFNHARELEYTKDASRSMHTRHQALNDISISSIQNGLRAFLQIVARNARLFKMRPLYVMPKK